MIEDEMAGWHHQLDGHKSEQAPGECERQGKLAHCSPWGHKESDRTEQLSSNILLKRDYLNNIKQTNNETFISR